MKAPLATDDTKRIFDLPQDYLQEGNWTLPDQGKHGDKDQDVLFASVGKALSAFENIETMLARAFMLLVESKSQAALRAYGSQTSAHSRESMLRYAGEVFFERQIHVENKKGRRRLSEEFSIDDYRTAFDNLLKVHKHCATVRNSVAHGVVVNTILKKPEGIGFFLIPAMYNSTRRHADPISSNIKHEDFRIAAAKYAYNSVMIGEYTKRFGDIAFAAWQFSLALSAYVALQDQ